MALAESTLPYTDGNCSPATMVEVDEWEGSGQVQRITHSKEEESQNVNNTSEWQKHISQTHHSKRKGRRKDETILSAMSQWIVEHQIGRLLPLSISRPLDSAHKIRPFRQSALAPRDDTYVLSSSSPSYSKVLSAFLL